MSSPDITIPTRQKRFFFFAIIATILGMAVYRASYLPETDTLWQIRAGAETLTSGHIPNVETWDWLIRGRAWLPNSWLWNVLLAVIYQAVGVIGLGYLNLLLCVGLFSLAWLLVKQLGASPAVQFASVVLFAVGVISWVTLRPQEIDYILLLAFFNVVVRFRNKPQRHPTLNLAAATFLITVTWMNFHLTATAALDFFPVGYILIHYPKNKQDWLTHIKPVIVIVAVTILALPVTPFFIDGIIKTISVSSASTGVIQEWGPLNFKQSIAASTATAIVIGGVAPVIFLIYRRKYMTAVALLALGVLSVSVIRFTPYLMIFALLTVMSLPATKTIARRGLLYLLIGIVVLILGVNASVSAFEKPLTILSLDPHDYSVIPANSRVLTLPRGGGSMLLFRPDLSPAMDGRNDLFGRDLYLQLEHRFYTTDTDATLTWLNQQHVNAVYFSKIDPDSPLLPALRKAHWVEHDFKNVTIFVRPNL